MPVQVSIGFGRADITPPLGTGLSGFGPFLHRVATSVHSPLYARAMAVDDGSSRWVIVSCDLLGLSERLVDETVRLVGQRSGLKRSEIALQATHSHSGPSTAGTNIGWGDEDLLYLLQLPHHIASACSEALEDLSPAVLRHCEVPVPRFSYNRMHASPGLTNSRALRWEWETPRPDLVDTTAQIFRVDEPTGRMKGFLSYFSCHPVICCESTSAIHGDFPAEALRQVESKYPQATGVFLQGALGDINPTYAHGPEEESFEALRAFGGRFAQCIEEGLESSRKVDDLRVGAALKRVPYEFGPFSMEELHARLAIEKAAALEGDLGAPSHDAAFAGVFAISIDQIIRGLESGQDIRRPIWVQSLALGPFVFTGFNLEVFHAIKTRHQADFTPKHLILSCTNGYRGYGPTRDAFHSGMPRYPVYEVPYFIAQLPFGEDIEDRMVCAAREAVLEATEQG